MRASHISRRAVGRRRRAVGRRRAVSRMLSSAAGLTMSTLSDALAAAGLPTGVMAIRVHILMEDMDMDTDMVPRDRISDMAE